MKQPLFRNKKTGNLYVIEAIAIDATNERDGNQVVVYHHVGLHRLQPPPAWP